MYDGALTQERDKAHSSVRVDVLCVEVSVGGHVVIGVGRVIVQRHHASINVPILKSHFLSTCELVVRLYVVIVTSFLQPLTAHSCTSKTVHLRCCVYSVRPF